MANRVVCDYCDECLDDSGPRPSFMLTLESSKMPTKSNSMYAIYVTPETPLGYYHFCGNTCLTEWLNK